MSHTTSPSVSPVAPVLVLGSSSPRRLHLLQQLGITPDHVVGPDIDETPFARETPAAYCQRIALEKNRALHDRFPGAFILTADTTVAVGRRILGKAATEEEEAQMLRLLSGRGHRVYTAVVLRCPDGRLSRRLNESRLKIKVLHEDEIAAYVRGHDWDGCAAARMLGGMFEQYISHISGSPSSIIGLPLFETAQMLRGGGYPL